MSEVSPVDILRQKVLDIIRENAARAERDNKFTKSQLNLAFEQRWFKIFVPTIYGGLQMPLPEALVLLEALTWAEGGFGWMVSNGALASWSSGFIEQEVAREIFGGDKVCVCGNELSVGKVSKNKDGYSVDGIFQNTAGAISSTAFVADCVRDMGGNGKPNGSECLSLILKREEIVVAPESYSMGLLAAENRDIELKDVQFAGDRIFKRVPAEAKVKGPLYQFPYTQIAETVIAANLSGMATHFIDLAGEIFSTGVNREGVRLADDLTVQETMRKQSQKFLDARTKFYYSVELAWRASANGQQVKQAILYKVTSTAADLSRRARECVDALYPFCGVQAGDKRTEINRVWRDIHTASIYGVALSGVGSE